MSLYTMYSSLLYKVSKTSPFYFGNVLQVFVNFKSNFVFLTESNLTHITYL